ARARNQLSYVDNKPRHTINLQAMIAGTSRNLLCVTRGAHPPFAHENESRTGGRSLSAAHADALGGLGVVDSGGLRRLQPSPERLPPSGYRRKDLLQHDFEVGELCVDVVLGLHADLVGM